MSSPAHFARGEVGPEAGAVTWVGTPEGSPPVSHHEFQDSLTMPLLMPATTSPAQKHPGRGKFIPMLGIGATPEVNSVEVTHRRSGIRIIVMK